MNNRLAYIEVSFLIKKIYKNYFISFFFFNDFPSFYDLKKETKTVGKHPLTVFAVGNKKR